MQRIALLVTLAGCLVMGFVGGLRADSPAASQPAENAKIIVAMKKNVQEMKYENVSLKEALEYLRNLGDLNMVVMWNDLEPCAVSPETAVSMQLKDVPLETALRLTLACVKTDVPLGYYFDNNVLVISTLPQCEQRKVLEAEHSLVANLPDNENPVEAAQRMQEAQRTKFAAQQAEATIASFGEIQYKLIKRQNELARQSEAKLKLVGDMKETCFDPQAIGVVAIGGLRNEIQQKPDALVAEFEAVLKETESLGLRNALHLTLKDLYLGMNEKDQAKLHLKAMIKENDQALQQKVKAPDSSKSIPPVAK